MSKKTKVRKFKGVKNKPPMPKPGELVDVTVEEHWYNEDTDTGFIRTWQAHDTPQGMTGLDAQISKARATLDRLVALKESFTE
jgi:hypothetical protein